MVTLVWMEEPFRRLAMTCIEHLWHANATVVGRDPIHDMTIIFYTYLQFIPLLTTRWFQRLLISNLLRITPIWGDDPIWQINSVQLFQDTFVCAKFQSKRRLWVPWSDIESTRCTKKTLVERLLPNWVEKWCLPLLDDAIILNPMLAFLLFFQLLPTKSSFCWDFLKEMPRIFCGQEVLLFENLSFTWRFTNNTVQLRSQTPCHVNGNCHISSRASLCLGWSRWGWWC